MSWTSESRRDPLREAIKAVARALGSKIYCDARKQGILLCETDPELHSMLTSDPLEVSRSSRSQYLRITKYA